MQVGRPASRPRGGVLQLAETSTRFCARDVACMLGVSVVTSCKLLAELSGAGKLAPVGAARVAHSKRPVRFYMSAGQSPALALQHAMRAWGM